MPRRDPEPLTQSPRPEHDGPARRTGSSKRRGNARLGASITLTSTAAVVATTVIDSLVLGLDPGDG